jgi:hypothetical protein
LGQGQRSFTEILAHLINCEARSSEAIYLALLADDPVLVDIHPERQLGKLLRYDQLAFADLLAYFKLRRTVLLRVLASLMVTTSLMLGSSSTTRMVGSLMNPSISSTPSSVI